jgi:hypothetical protein
MRLVVKNKEEGTVSSIIYLLISQLNKQFRNYLRIKILGMLLLDIKKLFHIVQSSLIYLVMMKKK